MNWWSPTSRKLRDLVCAAALSSISSTSFALSVTSDNADVQEIGWSKSIALDNANPTNALTSLTSTQPVVSSGVPQNTGVISASSTVVSQPTTSLSSTPSTVVSQPTISVTSTSSTLASPLPTTSSLANINLTYGTLSLTVGDYNVSSSVLDQGTLSLTAAGDFTLSIVTNSTLTASRLPLPAGINWSSVRFSYTGTNGIVVSGTVNQGGSVLQGILLALNATVSPAVVVSPSNVSLGDLNPAPLPATVLRGTVPDSGSTGILSCISFLVIALFRLGVSLRRKHHGVSA